VPYNPACRGVIIRYSFCAVVEAMGLLEAVAELGGDVREQGKEGSDTHPNREDAKAGSPKHTGNPIAVRYPHVPQKTDRIAVTEGSIPLNQLTYPTSRAGPP
jgi:hypothetical protein